MQSAFPDGGSEHLLTPRELAARQQRSLKSLAHDRVAGRGIPYVKIGRLCRYRLSDVLAFEQANFRTSTSMAGGDDA